MSKKLNITEIPLIMRKNNWINGAKLLEKWFASKANNVPRIGVPSTDIIKMNWVLSYPRAKFIYDKLVREKVWLTDPAKQEIINMLKRKGLLTNIPQKIGSPKMPLPMLDADSIQYRPVGGMLDMLLGDLDDLRAALARFLFKIVIVGEVKPILNDKKLLTGEYIVTIDEVGIYVKDSYDFNDKPGEDQPLGNWDIDDGSVGRTFFNGGDDINNSDFRNWRLKHKKGGDFYVYSDVIYLKQTSNNTFKFRR